MNPHKKVLNGLALYLLKEADEHPFTVPTFETWNVWKKVTEIPLGEVDFY